MGLAITAAASRPTVAGFDVLTIAVVAAICALVWVLLEWDARRYRRRIAELERTNGYVRRLADDERRVRDELYRKEGHRAPDAR